LETTKMARPATYSPGPLVDAGLDPTAGFPVPDNYRTPGAGRTGLGPTASEVLGVLSAMDRALL
jgi:hypothetical protein